MQLLPGIATADLGAVGAAVGEIQRRVGDYFAPAQSGRFTSPAVSEVLAWLEAEGITGVGQSSWGPTGFAILADDGARRGVAGRGRAAVRPSPPAVPGHTARNRGAEVEARRLTRPPLGRRPGPVQETWPLCGEADMTEPKRILHFVTPLKNVSPFDVNMAADAGFDVIVPYTDVDLKEVAGLVQDAIFSRAPEDGRAHGGADRRARADAGRRHAGRGQAGDGAAPLRDLGDGRPVGRLHHGGRHDRGRREASARQGQRSRRPAASRCSAAPGRSGGIAALIAAQAGAKVALVGYDGLQRVTRHLRPVRRAVRRGDDAGRRQRRRQASSRSSPTPR